MGQVPRRQRAICQEQFALNCHGLEALVAWKLFGSSTTSHVSFSRETVWIARDSCWFQSNVIYIVWFLSTACVSATFKVRDAVEWCLCQDEGCGRATSCVSWLVKKRGHEKRWSQAIQDRIKSHVDDPIYRSSFAVWLGELGWTWCWFLDSFLWSSTVY